MKLLTFSTAFMILFSGSALSNNDLTDSWVKSNGDHKSRAMTLASCSALTTQLMSQQSAGNAADIMALTAFKTAEMAKGLLTHVIDNESQVNNLVAKRIDEDSAVYYLVLNDESLGENEQALLQKNTLFCVRFNALSGVKPVS